MTGGSTSEVHIEATDGWAISGLVSLPDTPASTHAAPGAVLVPASRHERDAYTVIADTLAQRGIVSLRFDIRGRGASRGATSYTKMTPRQRQRVALDVAAAFDHLAGDPAVDPHRLALVAEQDTSADALHAVGGHERLTAVVVLSARHGSQCAAAISRRPMPVFGLVSKEDRTGLRATVDTYLAGTPDTSRLEVFDGLGLGTTMLSTRQFEDPDAEPLEVMIADWLTARLA